MRRLLPLTLAALACAACQQAKAPASNQAKPQPRATSPAALAQVAPPTPSAASAATSAVPDAPAVAPGTAGASAPTANLTGQVVETMNSGGYTYMKLRTGRETKWVAVREAKVKKGQTVAIFAQMTMTRFESPTLGRTFDTIVFGVLTEQGQATPVGISPVIAAAMAAGKARAANPAPADVADPMAASGMGLASQHMKVAEEDVKLDAVGGTTPVARVWASRDELRGQEVVVHGKVVKFLAGIMGTNWIHLQDGSGSGEKGDHDITVTTNDTAAVGEVVTLRGVLAVDKDFGAGYRYAAIIENAKLTR